MNKYEKLIEYIINDDEQKARELFHSIVVDRSREIYESIMDEEQMEETVAGDQVGNLVDEVGAEESMHEEEDGFDDETGEEEFSLDADGEEGLEGDLGGDDAADVGGDVDGRYINEFLLLVNGSQVRLHSVQFRAIPVPDNGLQHL